MEFKKHKITEVKKLKKLLCTIIIIIVSFTTGCTNIPKKEALKNSVNEETKEKYKNSQLKIITTNKLLFTMVNQIVKDKNDVKYLLENNNQSETFIINDKTVDMVNEEDLFIYNGAGFEIWAQKFIDKLNKNKVAIVNCSRGIKLLTYPNEIKIDDTVFSENPYYLYGIDNYKITLLNIKNAIEDRDPKNRDFYEKNFEEELKELDAYKKKFSDLSNKLGQILFISDENEMDYFIKNMEVKSVKASKESKLTSKISENKKRVFIYFHDEAFMYNADIIYKNNLEVCKLKLYDYDHDISEVMEYNIWVLQKLSEQYGKDDNTDENNKNKK